MSRYCAKMWIKGGRVGGTGGENEKTEEERGDGGGKRQRDEEPRQASGR